MICYPIVDRDEALKGETHEIDIARTTKVLTVVEAKTQRPKPVDYAP